jgi:hypothetical protein
MPTQETFMRITHLTYVAAMALVVCGSVAAEAQSSAGPAATSGAMQTPATASQADSRGIPTTGRSSTGSLGNSTEQLENGTASGKGAGPGGSPNGN